MLQIVIPATAKAKEYYDEAKNEFIQVKEGKEVHLTLEHSLVSLSKWESKWCKPFLGKEIKTTEETIDYIKCMTLTQNVDPDVYYRMTNDNIEQIKEYIDNPHTATTIYEDPNTPKSRETITSELIYYWMIALNIPFECQKWHLNRLLTLIRVCNIKNKPPKKMTQRQLLSRNAQLNAARRQKLHTKG
jgi:hypothetical protein